jgi:hypothetical protein
MDDGNRQADVEAIPQAIRQLEGGDVRLNLGEECRRDDVPFEPG